jgi:hypothetical protein
MKKEEVEIFQKLYQTKTPKQLQEEDGLSRNQVNALNDVMNIKNIPGNKVKNIAMAMRELERDGYNLKQQTEYVKKNWRVYARKPKAKTSIRLSARKKSIMNKKNRDEYEYEYGKKYPDLFYDEDYNNREEISGLFPQNTLIWTKKSFPKNLKNLYLGAREKIRSIGARKPKAKTVKPIKKKNMVKKK